MKGVKEVEEIKELIKRIEIENAKSQGIAEGIESKWENEYGFRTLEEAEKKLAELRSDYDKTCERKNKLEKELNEAQDWDKLEMELV